MSQVLEKTRYSDEELEEFKALIEEKLKNALDQLNFYQQQLEDLAESSDSKIRGLDDGVGTAENEHLYEMASRQQKLIQHLENALVRVHNKTYGICRATGKLIAKERLKAVPHATLCMEAKKSQ